LFLVALERRAFAIPQYFLGEKLGFIFLFKTKINRV
jgi:hypothetical protein